MKLKKIASVIAKERCFVIKLIFAKTGIEKKKKIKV